MSQKELMTAEEIAGAFGKGVDCSQLVLMRYAERYGLSGEQACQMGAAFGGGMAAGELCGALVGAMTVLGLEYGNTGADQPEAKQKLAEKRAEFLSAFGAEFEGLSCRDLLQYDISTPEGLHAILEQGLMMTKCPLIVRKAEEVLDSMFENA